MNSASQSEPSAAAARELVAAVELWSEQGRRMAAPAWFPLLCVSVTVLAWAPASLLLGDASAVYWYVVTPLSAVTSGWYLSTRPAQPAARPGVAALVTGMAMLLGVIALLTFGSGEWMNVAPWLILGCGLGVLALCWHSAATGTVAAVTLATSVLVAVIDPDQSQAALALIVGVAAAIGAVIDLLRTDAVAPAEDATA
ncbi:hypothetical protein [Rhodococcus gannanensis]|uniref:FUSC family protein n=1 Tax=Rhodococcus gannanensis TaxID=1960308 RepID=A0ABW4PD71_9NOCA